MKELSRGCANVIVHAQFRYISSLAGDRQRAAFRKRCLPARTCLHSLFPRRYVVEIVDAASRQQGERGKTHLDISHGQRVAGKPAVFGKMIVNKARMRFQLAVEIRFLHPLPQRFPSVLMPNGTGGLPRLLKTSFMSSSGISEPSA